MRAIVRYSPKTILVLCHIGHVLEVFDLRDGNFAGSSFALDTAKHSLGQPNRFDRLAGLCRGTGHESEQTA